MQVTYNVIIALVGIRKVQLTFNINTAEGGFCKARSTCNVKTEKSIQQSASQMQSRSSSSIIKVQFQCITKKKKQDFTTYEPCQ